MGDTKMATYVTGMAGHLGAGTQLAYTSEMFVRMRAGLPLALPPSGVAGPLPFCFTLICGVHGA
jgi:hypothetical protein